MPFKSEKQRKWMHANEPEMAKKWEKEDESVNEANASVIRKKLLKKFGEDPLYREFILAKTPKEQKKALKTLKSIRGGNAVRLMQKYVKKLQGESIKGKLRNVIRQEIKSINEAKARAGDYVKTVYGIGRIKKVRGSVAYIDLPDNKGRGYWPTDIRYLKPSGKKEKGKNLWLESVNESDLGLTYKKGKTVKVTHKKSGKELVIIDKPNVRKEIGRAHV